MYFGLWFWRPHVSFFMCTRKRWQYGKVSMSFWLPLWMSLWWIWLWKSVTYNASGLRFSKKLVILYHWYKLYQPISVSISTPVHKFHSTDQPTIAPSKTTVLILNSDDRGMPRNPILTDETGRHDSLFILLQKEDTSTYGACSITWRNELYVFGGHGSFKRQVSKLEGCTLTRIKSLDFDHDFGACANSNDDLLYLCFNNAPNDYGRCRFASDPTNVFRDTNTTFSDHRLTQIASSRTIEASSGSKLGEIMK